MSKTEKPARPTVQKRGYQPKLATEGYTPRPQSGNKATASQTTPAKPSSNPPNRGTAGKK